MIDAGRTALDGADLAHVALQIQAVDPDKVQREHAHHDDGGLGHDQKMNVDRSGGRPVY